jgi:hypothetical protein
MQIENAGAPVSHISQAYDSRVEVRDGTCAVT